MKPSLQLFVFIMLLSACSGARAQSGAVLWTYDLGYPIVTSPALGSDGTVYAGTMYGLSAITNTGNLASNKWTFVASIGASSPSIGADGTIFLASKDGSLYAINPDGTKQWSYVTQCGDGSPAVGVDGSIYVEGYSFLYALSAKGTLKWKFLLGDSANYSSPVIGGDGTVYIGARQSKQIYALAPDGTQKWTQSLALVSGDAPAIGANGTIYVSGGSLYALNPDSSVLWTRGGPTFGGPPIVAKNGTIYVCESGTHILYALSSDGQIRWHALGLPSVFPDTAPAIDSANILYYCSSNHVIALDSQGSVKWMIAGPPTPPGIDGAATSPILGPNGNIYAALSTVLYAIGNTNQPIGGWPMYQQNRRHSGSVLQAVLNQPQKRSDLNFEFELYPTELGLTYAIESSTNLNIWTSLTSIVATTLPTDVADLTATNSPVRFYRAVSSP
jgi:outer membrane protein assembly factor BamB